MALGDGSSWDETNPQQSTLANTLDSYDRDVRIGVRGRMALEHEWPSSQSVTSAAGYHKFITLQNQAAKPTVSGTQLAAVYTKTVGSGLQELFYENELGTEVQITSRTSVGTPVAVSQLALAWANFTVASSTCSVQGGYNIATVTYIGTGQYRVALGITMANTNYVPIAMARWTANNFVGMQISTTASPMATTSFILEARNDLGTVTEAGQVFVLLHGTT